MDKDTKHFFNNLKCPICCYEINIHKNDSTLYVCSNNHNHYVISLYEKFPLIKLESLNFFDSLFKTYYQIQKFYKENEELDNCIIWVMQPNTLTKMVKLNFDPISFKEFAVEKTINRIKNILIFQ